MSELKSARELSPALYHAAVMRMVDETGFDHVAIEALYDILTTDHPAAEAFSDLEWDVCWKRMELLEVNGVQGDCNAA